MAAARLWSRAGDLGVLLVKSGQGFGKIDQLATLISEVLDRVFALRSEGSWQSLFRLRPLRDGPRTAPY